MKRSPSFCHLLLIVPLFCATFIGCTASEDAALAEQLGRARAALKAKRYHEVLTLLHDTHRNAESPLGKEYGKEYDLMEGLASVKLGDYRRAVDALEKAQPLSLELRIDLAYLHLLLGDAQRARSIAAALELHHGQAPALAILQGNISLKEQAYHEAERHFRRAAVLDRSSAKAHIGLANTYLLQRYFIKAEENYLKAVSLSKTDASAYIALAHYHIVTGRYEDGIYTSEIALRKYPDNINILLARSNLFMHIGKISEGVDILKKSLKMFPHSIDLKINIIRGYYNIGRLDDAYHLIQDLLTDDHENYHGLILMGEYFLRKKDIDLAFFYFNKASLINRNSYIVNYYIGLIYLLNHKLKFSAQFLERSIKSYPGFIKSHILLSIIYIYQNKYDLASGHARAVLQLDPGNIHAHLVNGISLYLQNYFIESKYEFDVVRFLEEKNQISIIMQVLIGLAMGDVEQSNILIAMIDNSHIEKTFLQLKIFRTMDRKYVNDLEKFLDADTEGSANHLAFILLAHFYKERQDTARARYYLLKAKDANEGIVIPYYSLAELEASQGNRAVAIAYLQQAIARQPSFVKAYIALGSLYEQVKEYQKAKTAYETGLRYAPDDNVLLNNLAWVNLVHLGDKSAAYIGVRNALSLTPEDPDIQDTLAWWYYLNDEHHYALALLKKIVATSPANPLYRYHLGMVYLKLGEQQAARLHFHKAMELGIADEHRHVIAELLK